jgi:hypothetical protein
MMVVATVASVSEQTDVTRLHTLASVVPLPNCNGAGPSNTKSGGVGAIVVEKRNDVRDEIRSSAAWITTLA